ncbi:MAG: hypothetical protein D4S01_11650 [Dehalococcoidia bacterium]|nr:MAG: hypothetical protein D4S01_11625 [Dehalococcoidia bacterium]TRZ47798.1 MAG: hypothetical protein D4S01_11650 [Dehalococcoidia bacterium]
MEYKKTFTEKIIVTDRPVEKIKEYYKKRPWLLLLNIVATIIVSIIGYNFVGFVGASVGFLLGILQTYYMPSWKDSVKEIYRDR